MAKKHRIPVLLPPFIEECWSRSHLGLVDLRQLEVKHAVPVFHGCLVGVSGLTMEERQRVSKLVMSCGGRFMVELKAECTHLVVRVNTHTSSPKIQYAIKWGVTLVKPEWLYDSVSQRTCLEVTDEYRVDVEEASLRPTQSFPYSDLTAEEVTKVTGIVPYLDGMHIYVGDQQAPDRLALLKKLILVAGGTRYSDLFDKSLITHFIVHNQTLGLKEMELLQQFGNSTPLVVHDQWLFACFYARTIVPIDSYLVNVTKLLTSQNEPVVAASSLSQPIATGTTCWSLKLNSQPFNQTMTPHRTQPPNSNSSTLALPIFAGISFMLCIEEGLKRAELGDLIEQNGGQMVTERADYKVHPLIVSPGTITGTCVNEMWIHMSISRGHLVEVDSFLFVPIQVDLDPSLFQPLRISISGFAGHERDYYSRLVTALGATYTDNLSRRNTHLITLAASGPKYEFAKSVGIPIIPASWLIESARGGRPIDVESHLIVQQRSPQLAMPQQSPHPMGQQQLPSPMLPEMTSFGTPIQFSERENVAPFNVDTTPNTPASLGLGKTIMTSTKKKRPIASIMIETPVRCKVTKRLKEAAAEATPTGLTQSTQPTALLKGLIFAISQRLWHRREEMHELVVEMGGTFVWSYDPTCTHYIHQGNVANESFREFRTVRQHGKFIVSPWWLTHSRDAGQRLAESDYPHTWTKPGSAPPSAPTTPKAIDPSPLARREVPLAIPVSPSSIDLEAILAADERLKRQNQSRIVMSLSPMKVTKLESKPGPEVKSPTMRIFALSGLTAEQRSGFPPILTSYGGGEIAKSTTSWDPSATHLIIGTLNKSEKFLAACAAGVWILRPEYVGACERAGRLVEEESFEWRPDWNKDLLASLPSYWRGRGGKVFESWRVLLVADQKRSPGLQSILRAGGAIVGTLIDPITSPTHILVSSQQMKAKIPIDLRDESIIKSIDVIADHLIHIS